MSVLNLQFVDSRDPAASHAVREHLFGINMLFDRDHDEDDPTFQSISPNFAQAAADLGARTFRYPGGTLSERLFDLTNPYGTHQDYMGENPNPSTTMTLETALDYAGRTGMDMTLVMPTYRFLGTTADAAGHRFADVDVAMVRTFIETLLSEALIQGATIDAIELGNEWHVNNTAEYGTRMTPVEYGRIASALAAEIQQAINDFRAAHNLPAGSFDPDIVAQVGPGGRAEWFLPDGHRVPSGYTGPTVAATELIFREFGTDAAQAAIDGLVTHRYLTGSAAFIDGWAYRPFDTFERLAAADPSFGALERYVTEWNVSARNTEYLGLRQAGTIVALVAEMVEAGVDHANAWPVQQNNHNRLTISSGLPGEPYEGLSIAGETFRLLQGATVGLEYAPVAVADTALVTAYAFEDADKVVLYLASQSAVTQTWTIDPQAVAANYHHVWGVTVGIGAGALDDPHALPELTLSSADMLVTAQGLAIELDAYEVIQLVFTFGPTGVSISGSDRDDRILGSAHDDTMVGDAGRDTLVGGAGADTAVFGQTSSTATLMLDADGDVVVLLPDGVDLLEGVEVLKFQDRVVPVQSLLPGGTAGDDSLRGSSANDTLEGLGGADRLEGRGGDDTLEGGEGTDTLNGGAGDDFIFGGDGTADLRDVVFGGDGHDQIDGGYGNDSLNGGVGDDTLAGGFGADTLIGNADNDLIAGGAGSDFMFGNAGNDTLNGGIGFDRMNGGTGADQFFHQGVRDHGSDWIQDYAAAEGDVLAVGIAGATASQFQVNFATTVGAGSASVQEAFVIYRPTGQVLWALVDGGDDTVINLAIGGQMFDLLL